MLPSESSNTTPSASSQPSKGASIAPGQHGEPCLAGDMQDEQSAPAIAAGDPRMEGRWPASAALVMSWRLPATTARRTAHVSLARAWWIHLVGVVISAVSLAFVECIANYPATSWSCFDGAMYVPYIQYRDSFQSRPLATVAISVGIFVLLETAFLAIAFLAMPWGAADERLRDSLRQSVRQVWLRTVHAGVALFLGPIVFASLNVASLSWQERTEHLQPSAPLRPVPTPVSLPPTDPGFAEAKAKFDAEMVDYQVAIHQWNLAWSAYHGQRPWYLRHQDGIVVAASFGLALWFVWATLRAIGARRDVPPVARPPTCELCGYNLTTLPMDARCPECGEPVANSLGTGNRPGAPWDRSTTGWGMVRSVRQTHRMALRDPARLGRMIAITSWSATHRWFLAAHLVVIFLIGLGTCACLWWMTTGRRREQADWTEAGLFGTLAGIICVIGAIGWCVGSATVIGLVQSWRCRRNLLPASMRVSAYQVGYLVLWAALGGAMIDVWIALSEAGFFRELRPITRMHPDFVAVVTWIIPQAVCALWHWTLLYRGTSAARYANR